MSERNLMSKCLICESTTESFVDSQIKNHQGYVIYHACKACGFTYKDRDFLITKTLEKSQYDLHENTLENKGYVTMFENFIDEAITPWIDRGEALDYGSGPEPVLQTLLERKGFKTSIYDPFYAPQKDVLSKQYDLITSTEVFEHFYNPLKDIENIVLSLKKHGVLAIMTQLKTMDHDHFLTWWYRRDITHVSFYTLKTFDIIEEKFNLQRLYTNHKNIIVLKKR